MFAIQDEGAPIGAPFEFAALGMRGGTIEFTGNRSCGPSSSAQSVDLREDPFGQPALQRTTRETESPGGSTLDQLRGIGTRLEALISARVAEGDPALRGILLHDRGVQTAQAASHG